MKAVGIVAAAGGGVRAGGGVPKQYRPLLGRPVLAWSLSALSASPQVSRVILVRDPEHAPLLAGLDLTGIEIVDGGATRIASVRRGVEAAVRMGADVALVHDAARPGLAPDLVPVLLAALAAADAAAPALAVVDALKRDDASAVPRSGLHRVQTPQAVRLPAYAEAIAKIEDAAAHDDDLAIAEAAGLRIALVPGDERLFKITRPEDFAHVARLLSPSTLTPCVGTGFDAHRFGPGDHVTLCGVRIPHGAGLIGHSDADAGWHALTDAILGALSAGDIGDHFPPSDERWRGAPSETFLRRAVELVQEAGGRIAHADVTLICERPRIKPHRDAMRARTAEVMGLALARVSVKATTTEEMGFTGRREGLAALASATVLLPD